MATTLVQRLEQITGNEGDEFYSSDVKLHYLNESLRKLVDLAVQKEKAGGSKLTLRVLDGLRKKTNSTSMTLTAFSSFYTATVALPDCASLSFLRVNTTIPLRELTPARLHNLMYGNAIPSAYEGYYYLDGTSSRSAIVYVAQSSGSVEIFYVANPTAITDVTESLTEFKPDAEDVIINGAAVLMNIQGNDQSAQIRQQAYELGLQSVLK